MATGVMSWDNVTDEQFQAAADWLRAVHPNVRAYWADPSELAQLMASGEVQVAWSWNDPVAILKAENFPVGFNRSAAEGAASWYCGFVNVKDSAGNEEKAYDHINSLYRAFLGPTALDAIGYSLSIDAATAEIPLEALQGRLCRPGDHAAVRPVAALYRTARPHDRGIRDDQVGLLIPTASALLLIFRPSLQPGAAFSIFMPAMAVFHPRFAAILPQCADRFSLIPKVS